MMLRNVDGLIFTVVMFLCGKSNATIAPNSLEFRLPRDIEPINYDLEIFTPFKNTSTFRGKVCITVKCKKNTAQIVLHQQNLNIEKNVQIRRLPVTTPPFIIGVRDYEYDARSHQYVMKLRKSLEKDTNYEIEMEFSGNIKGNLDGLSLLLYDGTSRPDLKRIIYTWTDKVGARRIFPCFDELGMKATFTIRIGRPSTTRGFSNATFKVTKPASFPQDWFVDEFEKTVLMEASAVAIVVAESSMAPRKLLETSFNSEIRIFVDSDLQLEFLAEIAFDIFEFFSNYFKISFAFKHLNIFVLPGIASTAISSYGVIYLRETIALAASENRNSVSGYEMVSQLCHVISKQWIGYAVTMSDFRDDYIHTALNMFLQTLCVVQISTWVNSNWVTAFMDPSIINSFICIMETISEDLHALLLMGIDSTSSCDHEFKELAIAYHLIRMVNLILGHNLFEKSITNYLRKFEFANSNANDLWDAFTNTAMEVGLDHFAKYNLNVGDIVGSWINQTGYPLVTIVRNYNTKRIKISQKPFYAFDEIKPADDEGKCWLIPLSYTTKSKSRSFDVPPTISDWSTCKGPVVMEIDVPHDEWILFDLNVNGRINYDESNWDLIQKALVSRSDPNVFDGPIRARLTSDMFALAEVGELSYKVVLDAMKYLSREVQYEIFKLALSKFAKIYFRLMGTSVGKSFRKYVREILDPVFNREEFKNLTEYPTETNLVFKTKIIQYSCKFGVRACIKQSLEIIKNWKNRKGKSLAVPEIVHDTIHCQAIKIGNKYHWYFMWNFCKTLEGDRRRAILIALTCSTSQSLLERLLKWSMHKNDELFSKNDSWLVFNGLSLNRKGYYIIKRFFTTHYQEIYKVESELTLSLYWANLFDATIKRKDLLELESLAMSKGVNFVDRTDFLYPHHENAKGNIAWFERNKKTFDEYFGHGILNWRRLF